MSLDWVRRPRLRKKIIPINMENKQYNALFSFIWNIANDVLVHAFEKGDYKKIILPFIVLRRIDVLLEPTKADVLQKKEYCDSHGIVDYTPFLTQVTGYPFYNTSAFTKYFYKPVQLRILDAIMEDIRAIERATDGLLDEIMK